MAEVKRPVRSELTRRDRARATRLRITKAAYALFCERGYSGTTMIDIADAAGVAVQTVYFSLPYEERAAKPRIRLRGTRRR